MMVEVDADEQQKCQHGTFHDLFRHELAALGKHCKLLENIIARVRSNKTAKSWANNSSIENRQPTCSSRPFCTNRRNTV